MSADGPPAEVAWTVPGPRLLTDTEVCRVVGAALAHGGRAGARVSVVFVSDPELARLHGVHLGDPTPTDVMAFDLSGDADGPGEPVGELYVSVDRARDEAVRRNLAPEHELALYVAHGCLHLCGYDDHEEEDRTRMRAAEREVLTGLGYPS